MNETIMKDFVPVPKVKVTVRDQKAKCMFAINLNTTETNTERLCVM